LSVLVSGHIPLNISADALVNISIYAEFSFPAGGFGCCGGGIP